MKVYAFTDKTGKIVGTYQPVNEDKKGVHVVIEQSTQNGQKVQEIDIPQEIESLQKTSVDKFLSEVERKVKK